MEHFVREHPLYDVEQDLQGWLRQQAENIRQSTGTNDAAARDIAQRSAPPGGGRSLSPDMLEDLKKESDEQVARLSGVHDEIGKADRPDPGRHGSDAGIGQGFQPV